MHLIESINRSRRLRVVPVIILAAAAAGIMSVAWTRAFAHDYVAYAKQWTAALEGLDPYENTGNAYGPIFNLLAPLFDLHPKLPHLAFLAGYLGSVAMLILVTAKTNAQRLLLLLIIANPLFLVFGMLYGNNDLLLGLFVLLSIFYWRRKEDWSAILLAIGAGYKLLPALLAPAMSVIRTEPSVTGEGATFSRLSWRFMSLFAASLGVIFSIAYGVWGSAIFDPVTTGLDRKSKIFSIFRYLRGDYSFLRPFGLDSLDSASTLILGAALLIVYVFIVRNAGRSFVGIVALYSVLLMFYPVGHHQFYLPYTLVVAYAMLEERQVFAQTRVWAPIVLLLAWISFFSLLYHLTDGYANDFSAIREWVGLPTFLLQSWVLVALVRSRASGEIRGIGDTRPTLPFSHRDRTASGR